MKGRSIRNKFPRSPSPAQVPIFEITGIVDIGGVLDSESFFVLLVKPSGR